MSVSSNVNARGSELGLFRVAFVTTVERVSLLRYSLQQHACFFFCCGGEKKKIYGTVFYLK